MNVSYQIDQELALLIGTLHSENVKMRVQLQAVMEQLKVAQEELVAKEVTTSEVSSEPSPDSSGVPPEIAPRPVVSPPPHADAAPEPMTPTQGAA